MNSTKTYTAEQRAAVQDVVEQLRAEAERQGFLTPVAENILHTVLRNFREPHPADEAAENYATKITWNKRWNGTARAHLEDAFRAGWDAAVAYRNDQWMTEASQPVTPATTVEHTAEAMA